MTGSFFYVYVCLFVDFFHVSLTTNLTASFYSFNLLSPSPLSLPPSLSLSLSLSFMSFSVSHLYDLLDDDFIENFASDYCSSLQTFGGNINCNAYNPNALNGEKMYLNIITKCSMH